jgi:flavodoxin
MNPMSNQFLVVYYSYEGNTRFIAESIKKAINADLLELIPTKDMSSKGFMKYMWGGKDVILKKKPTLKAFDTKPEDYEVLFIGTPVWVQTYAPPLRTFFSDVSLRNKKVALFCCHEGGMGKTFEKMEHELSDNTIIGHMDFNHPLEKQSDEQAQNAMDWAKKITDSQ